MEPLPSPTLHMRLLGAFSVTLDGETVVGFESDKARALLAYLAVEADLPHPRDRLAGLLWPNMPNSAALANLRHALSNLRTVLADRHVLNPLLIANRQTIQFVHNDRCQLDLHSLTAAYMTLDPMRGVRLEPRSVHKLREADAAYRGPFLDGIWLDDCAAFEEWVTMTRARLQNHLLAILQALIADSAQHNHLEDSLTYTRRLLEIDPLHEETHRHLMRCLALSGQRTAALSQFETCRRLLIEELGVEPDAETLDLHSRVQRGELNSQTPTSVLPIDVEDARIARHNLPAPVTSFVGRGAEIAALIDLLQRDQPRLVTLTGPGGVGKTRLALEVAHNLAGVFADGVYFVPLAHLRDSDHLRSAIADALGLRESSSHTLEQAIEAKLNREPCLLVLDNFEHILTAAPAITRLLAKAPQLKIMVTSRSRLQLYGEYVFWVEPLGVGRVDVADVVQADAIELFGQRARLAQSRSFLNGDTEQVVAAICRHLDGLPLAIELAAARIHRLSPQKLLNRLTEEDTGALTVIAGGPEDLPTRQRSLRDTIRWSYNLLDRDDQTLFRQIAVFAGGFTAEAAEQVCKAVGWPLSGIEDRLWSLAENSLVRCEADGESEDRFYLLETIRQFGWESLQVTGELGEAQQAHAEYFLSLAERTDPTIGRTHQIGMLQRLEREIGNLRAALLWSLDSNSVEIALRLSGVLWDFWYSRGLFSEGYRWMMQALDLAQGQPVAAEYARALFGIGFVARQMGKIREAKGFFAACLDASEALGDKVLAADARVQLAITLYHLGDLENAQRLHELALHTFRTLDQSWDIGMILTCMSDCAVIRGDLASAQIYMEKAQKFIGPLGADYASATLMKSQSRMAYRLGDVAGAVSLVEKALHLSCDAGYTHLCAGCIRDRAMLAIVLSDMTRARLLLQESLSIFDRLGARFGVTSSLEGIICFLVRQGDRSAALLLAGAEQALHNAMGTISNSAYRNQFHNSLQAAREHMSQTEVDALWAQGQSMPLEEVVAFAQSQLTM